ncbi:MAG: hypothetical protein ABSD38_11760 [Syntrophorhabdales bacterium]
MAHGLVGDIQRDQGNSAAALKSYQDFQEISGNLAAQDPTNTAWQHDLAVSNIKVGDIQRDQGDLAAARKSYQDGLEIFENLAAQDPSNLEWAMNVIVSEYELSDFVPQALQKTEALHYLQRGLNRLLELRAAGKLTPENDVWVHYFQYRILELE